MLDPMREKCYLHIRAARIFIMQLELLEIRRLVALCHNEAPIVAEEPILATAPATGTWPVCFLRLNGFPACRRTKG